MNDMLKNSSEAAWESRELGATEAYVKKGSLAKEKALDDKLGLQVISIRLQKELIEALKLLAAENGLGYQPYVRQLLTQHVRQQNIKTKSG